MLLRWRSTHRLPNAVAQVAHVCSVPLRLLDTVIDTHGSSRRQWIVRALPLREETAQETRTASICAAREYPGSMSRGSLLIASYTFSYDPYAEDGI
jgi:hypothetical protein